MNVARQLSFGARLMRYLKDPAVPVWRKLSGLGAAIYVVWPLDALPDLLGPLGWLDDLGILGLAAAWMVREVQRHARTGTTSRDSARSASPRGGARRME